MNERIARVLQHKGHDVVTTTPETTVFAAVEGMNERRIGSVVVVSQQRIAGIFTERDVLMRVVARGLDPRTTLIDEVMSRNPVTIHVDSTISEALTIITTKRFRHLPVVDEGGLQGLISIGDLTSWIVRDQQRMIHDLQDYIRAA